MIAVRQQMPTKTAPVHPRRELLQRKCACGMHASGGDACAHCSKETLGLQRSLLVGASNDPLEREADRIADQVLRAPAAAAGQAPQGIQRFSGESTGQPAAAPARVEQVLASPGRPLDPGLRDDMEQRFGYDFSRVRVHADPAAEQSSQDVNANAYTVGHHMVFGADRFAPRTQEG
jgi:Domain of unknown function (DUF4157)